MPTSFKFSCPSQGNNPQNSFQICSKFNEIVLTCIEILAKAQKKSPAILPGQAFGKKSLRGFTISNATITVPVPDHKEIRAGTLMSTNHQSRLPQSEF
jgi:hypothetical protein